MGSQSDWFLIYYDFPFKILCVDFNFPFRILCVDFKIFWKYFEKILKYF